MERNKVTVFGMVMLTGFALVLAGCQAGPRGKIAFESYRDGNAEVYLMDANGANLVNMTNNPAYDGTPNWSPDGRQIAFTSERLGNPEIFVMGADGSNPYAITDGQGYNVVPAWSPDGTQILFASNRTYRIDAEGGYTEVPGNTKLWVMGADGSNPQKQTTHLGLDLYGAWSPDGQSIVFMSVRDGDPEIYLRRPDGFEVNLTNDPANDLNPDWSPDGKTIAFMSDREGNQEIYLLDLESGTLTNISQNPANDGDPAWSPDGAFIAFTSDRDGNVEIYVMEADGSNQRRLTNNLADDFHPQWQPQP